MIHLKQVCDTRRKRKDGTYPIVFRITFNRQSRNIPTGISCLVSQWDKEHNCLKPLNERLRINSLRLRDEEFKVLKRIHDLESSNIDLDDVQQIKELLVNKLRPSNKVVDFWHEEIDRLEKAKKYGNARNYRSALGGVSRHKKLNISFNQINFQWLTELETSLRSDGVKTNSISVYMRTLRSIYNKAINHELADANEYPFRRYKIKNESSSPRVANIEEMQLFFFFNPKVESKEFDPWNYGRLIFLLRGINFTDLALLTVDNLKDGRLIYQRAKTGKYYSVELLPLTREIIELYYDPKRITLFPILSNREYQEKSCHTKRISQCRKTVNKWLGKIGRSIASREPLTTYVFRYSHANICKSLGYSKDMISESLGHQYGLSVSSCYLQNYNLEHIDSMQSEVVHTILSFQQNGHSKGYL